MGNNNTVEGNIANEECTGALEATRETVTNIAAKSFFNVSDTVLVSSSNSCSSPVDPSTIQARLVLRALGPASDFSLLSRCR
jgi:hypothetical protein